MPSEIHIPNSPKICILGLGYVGLPLALEFSKKYPTIGLDISAQRISELNTGLDITKECTKEDLLKSTLKYTSQQNDIGSYNTFIVTVPTPINLSKQPDLGPIISATKMVAKVLKKGDVIIYESTVYPGCTEEVCVPLLEEISGLIYNRDFSCGYSPERVNPGDKQRSLTKIKKITSGSTPETLLYVDKLYASVIEAGTYPTTSIKIAEAAKVIENTQRDINIAFMNELSIIFNKMNIDTNEVLDAASTKWNFLPFRPGLVGGHCIGVDPYYLTHKAETLGYHPEIILAGRRINDHMGPYVANQVIKLLHQKKCVNAPFKILVMGITFKEDCPDIRNSKVIDLISELNEFGCTVDVYDPIALPKDVEHEYKIQLKKDDCLTKIENYDAIVFAVGHKQFKEMDLKSLNDKSVLIYDVKSIFPKDLTHGRL